MKAVLSVILLLVCLAVTAGGCGGVSQPTVTFDDLINHPEQYNNKTVTVDGIYINGWEYTVLVKDITYVPAAGDQQELTIVGNAIWFAGFLPQQIQQKLYEHNSPKASIEHFGKLRVTGVFEYGGNYGNVHQFRSRISLGKVELLDWTPPQ